MLFQMLFFKLDYSL